MVDGIDWCDGVKVARLITPVPGGVGPMTIAILLRNTVYSAVRMAEAAADRREEEAAVAVAVALGDMDGVHV